jgi:AmmeMemoRadiSam system protein B/AmmeMemoRadiSam system protein A
MDEAMKVREPAVADAFYPANKKELLEIINQYLEKATNIKLSKDEKIIGIISPHAGYVYSGQVAASAFKQIESQNYDTIIILGTAHRYPVRVASFFPKGKYKTPLGLIDIDEEITKELEKESKFFQYVPEAHKLEHSEEVQLPFLQVVLKNNFKIVPIVLSHFNYEVYENIAKILVRIIKNYKNKKFLIVASSDLSHYPDYKNGIKVDKESIELIKNFKIKEIIEREMNVENSGVPNLVTYYCGMGAIVTLLLTMQELGAKNAILVNYKNSGDVSWMKERIVGYTAMVFSKKENSKKEPEIGFNLSDDEKKFLLKISRKTLEEFVRNGKIPEFKIESETLKKNAGAFVTLKKFGDLRGCIGYILPVKPLYQAVIENTINACSRDFRFPPVDSSELKDIEIEISVLSPPVPVKSYNEIEIGKHGIILKKGFHQAVFLAHVAPEQGWDLPTTLKHLSLKAGLSPDDWKSGCEFEVFTEIVFKESDFK